MNVELKSEIVRGSRHPVVLEHLIVNYTHGPGIEGQDTRILMQWTAEGSVITEDEAVQRIGATEAHRMSNLRAGECSERRMVAAL